MRIDGLNTKQVELCNQLWACDTMETVKLLMQTLTPAERATAETLMQIMIMDSREEELSLMERYPDAEAMLERLKKDYL